MKKVEVCQGPDLDVQRDRSSLENSEGVSDDEDRGQRDQRHGHVSSHDDRQKDPMKIKLVLQRVFDFCDVETLKNIRLVSTEWLNDSLNTWRDKAVLSICATSAHEYASFKFEEYLQLLESDEYDEAELKSLKKYPFTSFYFRIEEHLDEFPSELLRPIADIARYLRVYSYQTYQCELHDFKEFLSNFRSLEDIRIDLCFDIDYDYNSHAADIGEFQLPEVKRLKVDLGTDTTKGIQAWRYMLKWFPNVKALSLVYGDIDSSILIGHLNEFLRIAKRLRQSGGESMLPLKELEINYLPVSTDMTGRGMESILDLMACGFPLERLTFAMSTEMIFPLLKSYKDMLQYLKISCEFADFNIETYGGSYRTTCRMSKLKELSLGKGHHRALCLLTYLNLPKLEKLTIEKDAKEERRIKLNYPLSFPKGRVYKALETLDFLDDHTMHSPKTIKTFARMMPNLVHLTIPLDKKTFQIVCEKFRGLKTLNVLSLQHPHEELDDETLTGILKEAEKGSSMSRRPNITDLALLTDVKICCDSPLRRNDVKFTDHSVIHGFLQLPRLFSLSIAFRDISEDIMEKLLDHVKGCLHIQEKPLADDHCNIEIDDECEADSDEGGEESGSSESQSEH